MIATELIKLPGLVDIHVHLRDPGQTDKEDFYSGTSAALAGGYTDVFDMPNNLVPITTQAALKQKITGARQQTVCNLGFYFGSLANNLDEFDKVRSSVAGLKLYLNQTTGDYLLNPDNLERVFRAWSSPKPILVHAEANIIKRVLAVTAKTGQPTHICHVSCREELSPIIEAKRAGLPVSCGVTPHHLFLSDNDARPLGNLGLVKPSLKPMADQDYLWKNLDQIDVIESDHAPHTLGDKAQGAYGFPGLETTLPLLLQAERDGRLTRQDIIDKCAVNPRRILGMSAEAGTYIEVEPVAFTIGQTALNTKCGWTPFSGKPGFGRVSSVFIKGKLVYENGKVVVSSGSGKII